jgi:hypothetical protein
MIRQGWSPYSMTTVVKPRDFIMLSSVILVFWSALALRSLDAAVSPIFRSASR